MTSPLPKKPIKRVVFSGGGAKGVVYPGSYKALVETGIYAKVSDVSGASAGSVTAAVMACGMSAAKFRSVFLNSNFTDLLGVRVDNYDNPGVTFFTKDGSELLMMLRSNIKSSINDYLEAHKKEIEDSEQLLALLAKTRDPSSAITFRDLARLSQKWPAQFKQFTTISVEHPSGNPQIFNIELTPDVEIALACRASCSIPVILEPVSIDFHDGKPPRTFVDGGVYDNLPTDYFDFEDGAPVPNTMKDQTLVFAFGEGAADDNNPVYQALYGSRMHEVISDTLLSSIIVRSVRLTNSVLKRDADLNANEAFSYAITLVLKQFVNTAKTEEELRLFKRIAETINRAAQNTLVDLLNNPQNYQEITTQLKTAGKAEKLTILSKLLKEEITPVLYKASAIEEFKRNTLISLLGGLKAPYKNTEQKEAGFKKLREHYPLRTVELRVGNLQTTDFDDAMKNARVMDALGYLDSINHAINHDLYDSEVFNPDNFYKEIIVNFLPVHRALLDAANDNPEDNALIKAMNKLKNTYKEKGWGESELNRDIVYLIKDHVEKHLDSPEAFALSRGIEFRSGNINANQLFKETYTEAFRRSPIFSQSKISSETIYKTNTLVKALEDKNMFELYEKNKDATTRTGKVYNALSNLPLFKNPDELNIQDSHLASSQGNI